jgi:hypothetical protein
MCGVSLARCFVVAAPANTNTRRAQSKGYLQEGPLGSKLELAGGGLAPPRCQVLPSRQQSSTERVQTECVQAVQVYPTLDRSLAFVNSKTNIAAV